MVDPGLDNRLRQRARRSGLAIALAMALTIAICIGAATLIYAGLVPLMTDFVPISAPTTETSQVSDGGQAAAQTTNNPPPAPTAPPAPTVSSADTAPTEAPVIAATEGTPAPFTPDYQISADQSVNFRAGPSRNDPILITLPPASPLQYLNEDAPATDPSDAPRWMKFRSSDGTEGWVRQIDTEAYQP